MKFLNLFIVCTWLSSGCAQYFAGLAGNVQVQNFIDQRHLKLDKFRDILTKRITDSHSRATALELLHNVLSQLKASAFPTAISENVDPQCRNDSLNYVHSYYSLALWALKMHESSGDFPEGVFGNFQLHGVGLFDECLAVEAPSGFRGKYCTVYFGSKEIGPEDIVNGTIDSMFPLNSVERGSWITFYQLLSLLAGQLGAQTINPQVADANPGTYGSPSVGLCIPSSCSAEDIRTAVSELVGRVALSNMAVVTTTDDNYCFVQSDQGPSFDAADISVLTLLSLIGILVLSATIHEAWRSSVDRPIDARTDSLGVRILHCFSALNNTRKLLSTKSSSDSFTCIHGIRLLSTTWVVMGHSWMMTYYQYNYNLITGSVKDAYKWEMQAILNATVSVDTFFLISGMLVSFLLMKELEQNKGKFNVILFYVHRYLRLTPVYAVIVGFVATLVVHLGSGPYWYSVKLMAEGCREEWWTNLLYINNLAYLDYSKACMGETWYLANDMQMFILSPLVIYPLWRWKKSGLLWLTAIMLGSLAANIALYAIYDLPPNMMPTRLNEIYKEYSYYYYDKPWTRVPPYLIGILVGWYLFRTRKSQITLPKAVVALCWLYSTFTGLAVVYGLAPFLDQSQVVTLPSGLRILYGSLHRVTWAIALGWVVFACIKGYGGVVNRFLSWRGFIPLGRLTYCVYLIHLTYLGAFFAHSRKPMYYTTFNQVHTFSKMMSLWGHRSQR